MNKYILIVVVVVGVFTLLYFAYMRATSYECITDLPDKPFIDFKTGQVGYYGGGERQIISKCKGGILAKFPIK